MIVSKKHVKFLEKFLPGRMDKAKEKQLGLTDSETEHTFGIEDNLAPSPGTFLSTTVDAIIGVATGMKHPFFVPEGKGIEVPYIDNRGDPRRTRPDLGHQFTLLQYENARAVEGQALRVGPREAQVSVGETYNEVSHPQVDQCTSGDDCLRALTAYPCAAIAVISTKQNQSE